MPQSITVTGLQEALDALTVFQRARIPGSTAWALNQFAFWLRENEQKTIEQVFNRKNNFTVNAPLYTKATKEKPSMTFFLRDLAPRGQSPDRYLEPQVSGGEVYVTRFSLALRRRNLIDSGDYALHWADTNYNATPGFIAKVLAALGNTGPVASGRNYARDVARRKQFFILGRERTGGSANATKGSPRDTGFRGYGIYTTKGGKNDLVFRILRKVPTVPKKYDWTEERMTRLANERLPKSLLDKLAEF